MERLDRVLSSPSWQTMFPTSSVTHLPLLSSDHCGLWLRLQSGSSNPSYNSYFKFLSPWLDHPDFVDQVRHSWIPSDNWNHNIDRLTNSLKAWNKNVFGNIFQRKKCILSRLAGIDNKLMTCDNPRLVRIRKELLEDYNKLVYHEELYWFQQAKVKWINLGVRNTSFFHQSSLIRQCKNRIVALLDDSDIWVYDDRGIRDLISQFYRQLYASTGRPSMVFFTQSSFPTILEGDMDYLRRDISAGEVRAALFSMQNLKYPSPDGFHPLFFKSQWDIVGPSIVKFIHDRFLEPSKIKDVNGTLITLIPNCDDPERVSQFRPIALCNFIYKVITKVIALRLRSIMPYIVNQSSFVPGRSTIDNILVLQETIHSFKSLHDKKGYMIVKLDLEKAYDRLEWPFIMDTLQTLGLPERIQDVIFHCISSANMSINWHGSPMGNIKSSQGIRQGDPISPYLFVLCLEKLGHKINDAINNGAWIPFSFGRGDSPKISHMCFADDIILVAEASVNQVEVMKGILQDFCAVAGQKINLAKSQVFFSLNTSEELATSLSAALGVNITKDLGVYLGAPMLHQRLSKHSFTFVLDKMRRKLSGWKASKLSFAGRVTLAQSSLANIPGYVVQSTPIPASVCEEAERICRDFIWGSTAERRKCHLIAWEQICCPKSQEGLWFRNLRTLNNAYMMKLAGV